MMPRSYGPKLRRWSVPIAGLVVFVTIVLAVWRLDGVVQGWLLWSVIMAAITAAMWRYVALPRNDRTKGRRLVMLAFGTSLFSISVWTQRNVQIEGLFFGLLLGVAEGAIIHYLLGKIVGPLVFGRVWCGWACWVGAILDLLPYRRSEGRVLRWTRLRSVHFGLSLLLVLGLWFGTGYGLGLLGSTAVRWFLIGNALYLLTGIVLAIMLKDNRAFCKYLCPVTIPLKLSGRFALLRVKGDRSRCEQDRACIKMCPMGIRITDYIQQDLRVLSTECILCQDCINACDREALSLSFGLDRGGKELLVERVAKPQPI